ncbi:MAG: hypothetical protein IJ346_00365 [Clostridia bacterium]|nr:hypothetical protein [Clostridia bacterium]
MNCPNCGGLLDLKNKRCEFCDTNFTEAELFPEKAKAVHTEPEVKAEPERKLTMTEQRQLEIQKEKEYRKAHPQPEDYSDISNAAIGATVMGIFGIFSGIRGFFRELKRVVCFILLIALEVGFGYLMISGVVARLFEGEIESFAAVNAVILVNALLAGLICRIGRIRVCTPLVGIVSFLAVVWVYIYPLVKTGFESVSAQDVAILAVIEMAVLALSVVLAHLIYRR